MRQWPHQRHFLVGGFSLLAVTLMSACSSTGVVLTSDGENTNAQTVKHDAAVSAATAAAVRELGSLDGASALETNLQLENRLLSDYELIKQVSSQISPMNIYDETMQPLNKKEKCLLPFLVNDSGSQVQLYWDGDCANGLAQGLGRVVRTVGGKKSQELLVEINPKQPNSLVSYLRYDVASGDSEVGYSLLSLKDDKLQGYSVTWGYNDRSWQEGNYEVTSRYEDTTNFMSYTKIVDLLSGEYSSIIAYPNFSHDLLSAHDNVLSNIDKTYRLLEGRTMIGLSYIWLKDGRLLVRDNSTGQDSLVKEHPQQLEDYIAQLGDKVDTQIEEHNAQVDQGFAKLEEYNAKKCRQLNAFFRGDEVNYVCDYLFNVSSAYDEFLKAQEQRSLQIDSYRESQEQRLKQLEQQLRSLKSVHLTSNEE